MSEVGSSASTGDSALKHRTTLWLSYVVLLLLLVLTPLVDCAAQGSSHSGISLGADAIAPSVPDRELAARIFPKAPRDFILERSNRSPPAWKVSTANGLIGYIASTWEISGSTGYSGRPIDILIGVTPDARISGAILMRHNEPVLTLGISTKDIANYIEGFTGYDLTSPQIEAFADSGKLPPIITGATVSTGVIRDGILRTARTIAIGRGVIATKAKDIERVAFSPRTWSQMVEEGSLKNARLSMAEAAERLGKIAIPLEPSDAPFIDAWVGLIDPPTIGRNLLGQQVFTRAVGSRGLGAASIFVASNGVNSHRGTSYRRSGVFDRIEVIQADKTIKLKTDDFLRIDRLALKDAPGFREMSVFRIPSDAGFEPSEPFRVEITAERERTDGTTASLRLPIPYTLPKQYILEPAAPAAQLEEPTPLWVSAWQRKPVTIAFVALLTVWVAGAFFVQEYFVARPQLWSIGRMTFLTVSLVLLGWLAKGQLSVVQVIAFMHSLLNGFHWQTFLLEPVIFMLWSFVALGLLFWGRGVYCGWLCPFGALQEILNEIGKRLGIKQIEVPFWLQERLWALKYTAFVGLLAVSFYSMEMALVAAEIEPFKTAITMHFGREWPFILYVLLLLGAGLFIERFYCRYLCPLGAALAIPAKIKLFDWLHRRPQCGRECRFCETQCTVGAIDTLGRINPNECILCLKCQVIMNDEAQCIALKRRAARRGDSAPSPAPAKG